MEVIEKNIGENVVQRAPHSHPLNSNAATLNKCEVVGDHTGSTLRKRDKYSNMGSLNERPPVFKGLIGLHRVLLVVESIDAY